MKNILVLVLGMLLYGCTTGEQNETNISVLEDVTETDFALTPSDSIIFPLLELQDDLWQAVRFRYGTLSDKEHNKRQEVTLEKEISLLGNSFKRKQKVKQYRKRVTALLQKKKVRTAYNHSTIWEPLVKEIQVLQSNTNSRTIIYLFSDLQENADWFSVYKTSDWMLLQNKREAVKTLFLEKAQGIATTSHISVVVAYQPKTRTEDQSFKIMKELYTSVFSELGIPIHFVANLNTYYL